MSFRFTLEGAQLEALPCGALWWPAEGLLAVADLHLGKSERIARRGGPLLPPFETAVTLARLREALTATQARTVLCLGDSFDDSAAAALPPDDHARLLALMDGRRWLWVTGNHDPHLPGLPGEVSGAAQLGPLTFRHIAQPGAQAEISGHYHPKVRLAGRARPCFLLDSARVILPAFGAYTGGLWADHATLSRLLRPEALAVLTGEVAVAAPLSRLRRATAS